MTKLISLGFCLLLPLAPRAAEPELYSLARRSEYISERGMVDGWSWHTESAILNLLPPPNWDASVKIQDKKLVLRYAPLLSGITIRVVTNTPGQIPHWAAADALRKQTLKTFPEAIIREEYLGHSSAGTCPIIEVEVQVNGVKTCHRVAWLAFKGGLIELELLTPERYLTMCHGAWTTVLNSLHVLTTDGHG